MPSICFILDTSGSMSTRCLPRFTYFDMAKNYIEMFIKARFRNEARIPNGKENDKYYLVTNNGRYPENVRVMSEKTASLVIDEVKKMQYPFGVAPIQQSILDAFKMLIVMRAQTGIDSYGAGRACHQQETVLMVLLTDGSGAYGIPADFKVEIREPYFGSELTREAFRWDQKLFSVVYRIPSTPYRPTNSQINTIDIDMPVIERMCASTGGRSFSIVSHRQIATSIDMILCQSFQHKLGVRFDCLPALHFTAGKAPREDADKHRHRFKRILEKRPVTNLISRMNPNGRPVTCHWPIPESFFPHKNTDKLQQRLPHPLILVAPEALPLQLRHEVAMDKLELEPGGVSEIVMEMLQGEKADYTVWTYIEGASNGPTAPFGCLRWNAMRTGIVLILLPYNFPVFFQLVEDLVRDGNLTHSVVWRQKLESYFSTVPFYYFNQLRYVMEKLKCPVELSGSMSSIYTGNVLTYLNKLKAKAKEEFDSIILKFKAAEKTMYKPENPFIRIERITSRTAVYGLAGDDEDHEEEMLEAHELMPIYSQEILQIPLYPPHVNEPELDNIYRTPLGAPIDHLVGQLNRIQSNIELLFDPRKITLLDMGRLGEPTRFNVLEEKHNMSMSKMGNYNDYTNARIAVYGHGMKSLDEETKERPAAFGNPYKMKGLGAGVDEVMDSAVVDSTSQKSESRREARHLGGPPKRRRGPLGIDAFNKYRVKRSTRGSSVASDISEDISGALSDVVGGVDDDIVILDDMPGTSTSYSERVPEYRAMTPTEHLGNLSIRNGDSMEEMDSLETLQENLETVLRRREQERLADENVLGEPSPKPHPSRQEMMTRKIRIGSIVRQPANHRAYDEILDLTTGIALEAARILMRYAMRESQRFKLAQLTKKLEGRLDAM